MISTQRYFIHIENKSVVPWTSEIEDNYKFKEITLKIAMAIENGKISADEVVEQIMKQIKPGTLEQMLDAKLKMNVREGELNLEQQVRDDNTQKDTGEAKPFDINLSGEGDQTSGGKKQNGKPSGKPAGKPSGKPAKDKPNEPPAEAPSDVPGAEAPADDAEKVAAALDGNDGEPSGGVNV